MSMLSFDINEVLSEPETFPDVIETIEEEERVNHPNHYQGDKFETIDVIEDIVKGYNSECGFSIGNVIKYVSRAPKKNGVEDLKKARWYLDRAIEKYEFSQK